MFARVQVREIVPEVQIEKKTEATAINTEVIDQLTKKEKVKRNTN